MYLLPYKTIYIIYVLYSTSIYLTNNSSSWSVVVKFGNNWLNSWRMRRLTFLRLRWFSVMFSEALKQYSVFHQPSEKISFLFSEFHQPSETISFYTPCSTSPLKPLSFYTPNSTSPLKQSVFILRVPPALWNNQFLYSVFHQPSETISFFYSPCSTSTLKQSVFILRISTALWYNQFLYSMFQKYLFVLTGAENAYEKYLPTKFGISVTYFNF